MADNQIDQATIANIEAATQKKLAEERARIEAETRVKIEEEFKARAAAEEAEKKAAEEKRALEDKIKALEEQQKRILEAQLASQVPGKRGVQDTTPFRNPQGIDVRKLDINQVEEESARVFWENSKLGTLGQRKKS